jgi:hypothetical protein
VHCQSLRLKLFAHQSHFKCFCLEIQRALAKPSRHREKELLKEDSKCFGDVWSLEEHFEASTSLDASPSFPNRSFPSVTLSIPRELKSILEARWEMRVMYWGREGEGNVSSWIVGQAHGRNRKHRGRSSTVVWPLPHHFRGMTFHLGIVAQEILHFRNTSTWQQCLFPNHRQKLQDTQCLVAGPPK